MCGGLLKRQLCGLRGVHHRGLADRADHGVLRELQHALGRAKRATAPPHINNHILAFTDYRNGGVNNCVHLHLPAAFGVESSAKLLCRPERLEDSLVNLHLSAPSSVPPRWVQCVQELAIVSGYCPVAARPAFLPEDHWGKGAFQLVYAALARALSFALLELLTQHSHSCFDSGVALQTLDFRPPLVDEILERVRSELVRSKLAQTRVAGVRFHAPWREPLCTASLADQLCFQA